MGKSSAPAAPDYTSMAKEQARGNLELAQYNTQANRINQTNPYGSLSYSAQTDPNTGMQTWSQSTNLSPEQQQLFNQQQQTKLGLAGMQGGLLGNVQDAYSQPFDMQSVQDIADKSYSNYTQRLDPQWDQRQKATETQLANQGIAPGTEAYTNAMRDFNAGRNDAYSQAQTASFNLMPQTYNLGVSARNQPFQELQNIGNASAAQTPNFGNYAQQQGVQGADITGAAQSQYGAQLGQVNANNANAASTNAGLLSLAAYFMSDERLKTNIKRLGTHPDYGIGIYSYDKFGKPEIGVMAQELEKVRPDAVATHDSGYKMVDYNKV